MHRTHRHGGGGEKLARDPAVHVRGSIAALVDLEARGVSKCCKLDEPRKGSNRPARPRWDSEWPMRSTATADGRRAARSSVSIAAGRGRGECPDFGVDASTDTGAEGNAPAAALDEHAARAAGSRGSQVSATWDAARDKPVRGKRKGGMTAGGLRETSRSLRPRRTNSVEEQIAGARGSGARRSAGAGDEAAGRNTRMRLADEDKRRDEERTTQRQPTWQQIQFRRKANAGAVGAVWAWSDVIQWKTDWIELHKAEARPVGGKKAQAGREQLITRGK
ncbi:hypothetical protein FB451DRAFT_1182405 [Mycena latifolia]|nr:hypothetical protein FB451DRAFT_1185651 [Mycena latifolia]KAJ7459378.1 hypothetical protein FB451DRAFT_1182405 [Mycena latifolia]